MALSDLAFDSRFPIDKIVQEDQVSYTLAVGTPSVFAYTDTSLKTIANSYGQKALIKASWSLDGLNFNSTLVQQQYYSATFNQPILKALVTCGVSNAQIYFYLINNFTTDLTFTIKYAVYTIS